MAKGATTAFVPNLPNLAQLVLRAPPAPTRVRTPIPAAVLLQQRAIMSAVAYLTSQLATLRAPSLRIVNQAMRVLLISAVTQAPVSKSRISRAVVSDTVVNTQRAASRLGVLLRLCT